MARFSIGTLIVGFLFLGLVLADWLVTHLYTALRAVGL